MISWGEIKDEEGILLDETGEMIQGEESKSESRISARLSEVLKKVEDRCESWKDLSLRDWQARDLNTQGVIGLLEERAKAFVSFVMEEGAKVGLEGARLVAKDEHLGG
jgi:hypothetical protein